MYEPNQFTAGRPAVILLRGSPVGSELHWKTTLKPPMTMIPAFDQNAPTHIRIAGSHFVFPESFMAFGFAVAEVWLCTPKKKKVIRTNRRHQDFDGVKV